MDKSNANTTKLKRFLIVRTDRIGDVLLSVPVATAIKQAIPDSQVTLLCRHLTAVIGERNPDVDAVLTMDTGDGRRHSFYELVRMIRAGRFDCAVMVHSTFYLAIVMAFAGIPVRLGTGFRFYSVLFNRRHYEHRKISIKHETDYNLGLLKALHFSPSSPLFQFIIEAEDRYRAAASLNEAGIADGERYCVVHPWSGGSAMDWPLRFYAAACDLFVEELNTQVIVSRSPGEKELAEELHKLTCKGIHMLPDVLPIPVLAAVLSNAVFLLAPSTGVLHLAHTVGTPVIGLYPPVKHESPTRWGPYGKTELTLMPDINDCPSCRGTKCRKLHCMELITPDMVLRLAQKIISENTREKKQTASGKSIHS